MRGYLSFISSGKFFEASYSVPLVTFLANNFQIKEIINFDDLDVFKGISAYPLIFTSRKKDKNVNYTFNYFYVPEYKFNTINEIVSNLPFKNILISDFIDNGFKFLSINESKIFKTINNNIYLKDINCLPLVVIKTGYNDGFITKNEINIVFSYSRNDNEYYLVVEEKLEIVINQIKPNQERLEKRAIIKDGIKNNTKKRYEYQQINKKVNFDTEYIVYPNVSLGANFTLSKSNVIDMTNLINGEKIDLKRQDHRDEIIKRNKKLESAIKNGIYSGVKIEIEITAKLECLKCENHIEGTNYHVELDDCIEENIPNVTCDNCETIYI